MILGIHWRWWASAAAMVVVAGLEAALPAPFAVLAFLWVPVVLSAAFAVPQGTAALAGFGFVLALGLGWLNSYLSDPAYWARLAAMILIAALAIYLADVTADKVRRLNDMSTTDTLTGIPNRRLLMDRLEAALSVRHRQSLVAVLFIDLDRFKLVNSLHNHSGGDEVLKEVARRFRATVRREDTVARFGGDEFAIACPAIKDTAEVTELCTRLIESMQAPMMVVDGMTVGATIGVAVAGPDSTIDAAAMIELADTELMRAKSSDPGASG